MGYCVVEYEDHYKQDVIDLILPIQQEEFNVPVTIQDQPDLQNILSFYKKGNGNFWVALFELKVVGTIGIIDFDGDQVALRKMFVHHEHRGKEKGVGQLLLDELRNWCEFKNVKAIFLGTVEAMYAAHRFYQKNGFTEILKTELPKTFPLNRVDNKFFKCNIQR